MNLFMLKIINDYYDFTKKKHFTLVLVVTAHVRVSQRSLLSLKSWTAMLGMGTHTEGTRQ